MLPPSLTASCLFLSRANENSFDRSYRNRFAPFSSVRTKICPDHLFFSSCSGPGGSRGDPRLFRSGVFFCRRRIPDRGSIELSVHETDGERSARLQERGCHPSRQPVPRQL